MVFEKAAGRKGRGPKDADPAYFLAADQWPQPKIQPHRGSYGQQRTEQLAEIQSKKDRFLIVPDFLWYLYFYGFSLLSVNYNPNNSLTIRSLILTAPTKTSKLKITSMI